MESRNRLILRILQHFLNGEVNVPDLCECCKSLLLAWDSSGLPELATILRSYLKFPFNAAHIYSLVHGASKYSSLVVAGMLTLLGLPPANGIQTYGISDTDSLASLAYIFYASVMFYAYDNSMLQMLDVSTSEQRLVAPNEPHGDLILSVSQFIDSFFTALYDFVCTPSSSDILDSQDVVAKYAFIMISSVERIFDFCCETADSGHAIMASFYTHGCHEALFSLMIQSNFGHDIHIRIQETIVFHSLINRHTVACIVKNGLTHPILVSIFSTLFCEGYDVADRSLMLSTNLLQRGSSLGTANVMEDVSLRDALLVYDFVKFLQNGIIDEIAALRILRAPTSETLLPSKTLLHASLLLHMLLEIESVTFSSSQIYVISRLLVYLSTTLLVPESTLSEMIHLTVYSSAQLVMMHLVAHMHEHITTLSALLHQSDHTKYVHDDDCLLQFLRLCLEDLGNMDSVLQEQDAAYLPLTLQKFIVGFSNFYSSLMTDVSQWQVGRQAQGDDTSYAGSLYNVDAGSVIRRISSEYAIGGASDVLPPPPENRTVSMMSLLSYNIYAQPRELKGDPVSNEPSNQESVKLYDSPLDTTSLPTALALDDSTIKPSLIQVSMSQANTSYIFNLAESITTIVAGRTLIPQAEALDASRLCINLDEYLPTHGVVIVRLLRTQLIHDLCVLLASMFAFDFLGPCLDARSCFTELSSQEVFDDAANQLSMHRIITHSGVRCMLNILYRFRSHGKGLTLLHDSGVIWPVCGFILCWIAARFDTVFVSATSKDRGGTHRRNAQQGPKTQTLQPLSSSSPAALIAGTSVQVSCAISKEQHVLEENLFDMLSNIVRILFEMARFLDSTKTLQALVANSLHLSLTALMLRLYESGRSSAGLYGASTRLLFVLVEGVSKFFDRDYTGNIFGYIARLQRGEEPGDCDPLCQCVLALALNRSFAHNLQRMILLALTRDGMAVRLWSESYFVLSYITKAFGELLYFSPEALSVVDKAGRLVPLCIDTLFRISDEFVSNPDLVRGGVSAAPGHVAEFDSSSEQSQSSHTESMGSNGADDEIAADTGGVPVSVAYGIVALLASFLSNVCSGTCVSLRTLSPGEAHAYAVFCRKYALENECKEDRRSAASCALLRPGREARRRSVSRECDRAHTRGLSVKSFTCRHKKELSILGDDERNSNDSTTVAGSVSDLSIECAMCSHSFSEATVPGGRRGNGDHRLAHASSDDLVLKSSWHRKDGSAVVWRCTSILSLVAHISLHGQFPDGFSRQRNLEFLALGIARAHEQDAALRPCLHETIPAGLALWSAFSYHLPLNAVLFGAHRALEILRAVPECVSLWANLLLVGFSACAPRRLDAASGYQLETSSWDRGVYVEASSGTGVEAGAGPRTSTGADPDGTSRLGRRKAPPSSEQAVTSAEIFSYSDILDVSCGVRAIPSAQEDRQLAEIAYLYRLLEDGREHRFSEALSVEIIHTGLVLPCLIQERNVFELLPGAYGMHQLGSFLNKPAGMVAQPLGGRLYTHSFRDKTQSTLAMFLDRQADDNFVLLRSPPQASLDTVNLIPSKVLRRIYTSGSGNDSSRSAAAVSDAACLAPERAFFVPNTDDRRLHRILQRCITAAHCSAVLPAFILQFVARFCCDLSNMEYATQSWYFVYQLIPSISKHWRAYHRILSSYESDATITGEGFVISGAAKVPAPASTPMQAPLHAQTLASTPSTVGQPQAEPSAKHLPVGQDARRPLAFPAGIQALRALVKVSSTASYAKHTVQFAISSYARSPSSILNTSGWDTRVLTTEPSDAAKTILSAHAPRTCYAFDADDNPLVGVEFLLGSRLAYMAIITLSPQHLVEFVRTAPVTALPMLLLSFLDGLYALRDGVMFHTDFLHRRGHRSALDALRRVFHLRRRAPQKNFIGDEARDLRVYALYVDDALPSIRSDVSAMVRHVIALLRSILSHLKKGVGAAYSAQDILLMNKCRLTLALISIGVLHACRAPEQLKQDAFEDVVSHAKSADLSLFQSGRILLKDVKLSRMLNAGSNVGRYGLYHAHFVASVRHVFTDIFRLVTHAPHPMEGYLRSLGGDVFSESIAQTLCAEVVRMRAEPRSVRAANVDMYNLALCTALFREETQYAARLRTALYKKCLSIIFCFGQSYLIAGATLLLFPERSCVGRACAPLSEREAGALVGAFHDALLSMTSPEKYLAERSSTNGAHAGVGAGAQAYDLSLEAYVGALECRTIKDSLLTIQSIRNTVLPSHSVLQDSDIDIQSTSESSSSDSSDSVRQRPGHRRGSSDTDSNEAAFLVAEYALRSIQGAEPSNLGQAAGLAVETLQRHISRCFGHATYSSARSNSTRHQSFMHETTSSQSLTKQASQALGTESCVIADVPNAVGGTSESISGSQSAIKTYALASDHTNRFALSNVMLAQKADLLGYLKEYRRHHDADGCTVAPSHRVLSDAVTLLGSEPFGDCSNVLFHRVSSSPFDGLGDAAGKGKAQHSKISMHAHNQNSAGKCTHASSVYCLLLKNLSLAAKCYTFDSCLINTLGLIACSTDLILLSPADLLLFTEHSLAETLIVKLQALFLTTSDTTLSHTLLSNIIPFLETIGFYSTAFYQQSSLYTTMYSLLTNGPCFLSSSGKPAEGKSSSSLKASRSSIQTLALPAAKQRMATGGVISAGAVVSAGPNDLKHTVGAEGHNATLPTSSFGVSSSILEAHTKQTQLRAQLSVLARVGEQTISRPVRRVPASPEASQGYLANPVISKTALPSDTRIVTLCSSDHDRRPCQQPECACNQESLSIACAYNIQFSVIYSYVTKYDFSYSLAGPLLFVIADALTQRLAIDFQHGVLNTTLYSMALRRVYPCLLSHLDGLNSVLTMRATLNHGSFKQFILATLQPAPGRHPFINPPCRYNSVIAATKSGEEASENALQIHSHSDILFTTLLELNNPGLTRTALLFFTKVVFSLERIFTASGSACRLSYTSICVWLSVALRVALTCVQPADVEPLICFLLSMLCSRQDLLFCAILMYPYGYGHRGGIIDAATGSSNEHDMRKNARACVQLIEGALQGYCSTKPHLSCTLASIPALLGPHFSLQVRDPGKRKARVFLSCENALADYAKMLSLPP